MTRALQLLGNKWLGLCVKLLHVSIAQDNQDNLFVFIPRHDDSEVSSLTEQRLDIHLTNMADFFLLLYDAHAFCK